MKFSIKRELLLNSLIDVSRGLSDKKPLPVLTGIKIDVRKNEIIFTTTNKEISIQIVVNSSQDLIIEKIGVCVIPGKYFVEIVKKLEGDFVDFILFEEKTIKIISDRSDFTLIAYEDSLFPEIDFKETNNSIVINSKLFKQIIKQTTFAAATSESRIVLTSVNFKAVDDVLTVTATDSFRLARKNIGNIPNVSFEINIPSKSLEEFSKILLDENENIHLFFENRKVLFKYRNVSFLSSLIDGVYPNTASLFPKDFLLSISFNRNELLSAVDRASLFTTLDSLSLVKMIVSDDNKISVSSNSTEIGRVVEQITPISCSKNMEFQIAFSTKYLLEALKSYESDVVTLNFTGEIKPAVISGVKDKDLTQLLLPVRMF